MKSLKATAQGRSRGRPLPPETKTSAPELSKQEFPENNRKLARGRSKDSRGPTHLLSIIKSPREGFSASEERLPVAGLDVSECPVVRGNTESDAKGDDHSVTLTGDKEMQEQTVTHHVKDIASVCAKILHKDVQGCKPETCEKHGKCTKGSSKAQSFKHSSSPIDSDVDDYLARQIRDIHNETRKSVRIIRDSKLRVLELQKKPCITELDVREIGERNELLLREMARFEKLTRTVQTIVGGEAAHLQVKRKPEPLQYIPGCIFDPPPYVMDVEPGMHARRRHHSPGPCLESSTHRSKSEIDLTRKLNESYDMQEKLVADNADMESKRYILYKELMAKDQRLETSRAQIKRLQGELKMMGKENSLLLEKLNRNHAEGDATAKKNTYLSQLDFDNTSKPSYKLNIKSAEQVVEKLENYKTSSAHLEQQLGGLEFEVRHIRLEMDNMKSSCRAGPGGQNSCFQQPPGPPVPPLTRACGVCPPCPAPCNPMAVPTPAEREVARLTILQRNTEDCFKGKVTECAMLRAELLKKKEELEKERCQHREVGNKLRELELRFEGLTTATNMNLGTKEQALENEVNVRTLRQCYRDAREEIDELRLLMKEQNDQLQDYRVKYLQAQQLVEEQRKQMDLMDMDNTRISEQINLEIQRVKLRFQEKLQELAPIPDLLKATQMKLKDAQQSQAVAEHTSEQLARELNVAREKVHTLLYNITKAPPEKNVVTDDKAIQLLQQRIQQLTEVNTTTKNEVERLKGNVIRMEEQVLASDKRLQEKMHECAAIGGELDRARDEGARAVQRANERTETLRKCMQTTVAELERQLASARAQVSIAKKERQDVQARMQCQIKRLNENFEQAQLRILGLSTQVATLRREMSDTGMGDADQQQECACKTFFEDNTKN